MFDDFAITLDTSISPWLRMSLITWPETFIRPGDVSINVSGSISPRSIAVATVKGLIGDPGSIKSVTARLRTFSGCRVDISLGLKAGCAANAITSPVKASTSTALPPAARARVTASFNAL